MANHRVFVYGSLRLNQENNSFLVGSKLVERRAETQNPHYDMISLGAYPGVIPNGAYYVLGDLYEVDDDVMERLDRLESNGTFYERRVVEIRGRGMAWLYFILPDFATTFDGDDRNPGVLREQHTVEWAPRKRGEQA